MSRDLPKPLALALVVGLTVAGCAAHLKAPHASYSGDTPRAERTLNTASTESIQNFSGSYWRDELRSGPKARALAEASKPAPPSPPSRADTPTGSAAVADPKPRPHRAWRRPPQLTPASGQPTTAGTTKAAAVVAPTVVRSAQVPRGRLILYHGTLALRVFKRVDGINAAQQIALEAGAYVQSRSNGRLVLRVPVGHFHELMARLCGVGEVVGKSINARDVTQQFYDVTYRLRAAKAVLDRLKGLLAKAKNVRESLEIEKEMSRLLLKIERFKGLLRYLNHHASLSTITVHFHVKPRYTRPIRSSWRSPFGWVKRLGLYHMMRF
ncbi:MAG: DUF4349 domain-containing protein [bacterium]